MRCSVAHEHFLGDGGNVNAIDSKDMTERQTTSGHNAVTRDVVQMPLIGLNNSMEPDCSVG